MVFLGFRLFTTNKYSSTGQNLTFAIPLLFAMLCGLTRTRLRTGGCGTTRPGSAQGSHRYRALHGARSHLAANGQLHSEYICIAVCACVSGVGTSLCTSISAWRGRARARDVCVAGKVFVGVCVCAALSAP